jgi:DNA mismatch endonuclease Vsr
MVGFALITWILFLGAIDRNIVNVFCLLNVLIVAGRETGVCKKSPGKPDIVLTKYKTVIFIHGCFWHVHKNLPGRQAGCKYFVLPKTRTKWWTDKINRNKANDEKAVKTLRKEGWKVITVWECSLKPAKFKKTLASLFNKLSPELPLSSIVYNILLI